MYYPTEYGRKVCLRLDWIEPDKSLASDCVFGQGAMRRARRTLAEGPIKIHGPFLVHHAKQRAMGTVLESHGENMWKEERWFEGNHKEPLCNGGCRNLWDNFGLKICTPSRLCVTDSESLSAHAAKLLGC